MNGWAGWLVGLALLVALGALMLLPGVRRGLLERRRRRAIELANARIDLEVPRFLLTRRARLLARLEEDDEVRAEVARIAREDGVAEGELAARVQAYAREIVPAFSLFFYFHLGYRLARGLLRLHYTVRTAHVDRRAATWTDPNSTVVMLLNHRTNMDVLLLNYLASGRSTLSHAAGEWARLWPFSLLVRAAGNYVVDRRAGDPLYRVVLARYVHMATRAGVPQAIFPEGELSRDGTPQPIKLGLLAYVIRAFEPHSERDISFIPVAVNYDRVPEDSRLIRDPDKVFQQRGKLHLALASLKYSAGVVRLALRRRECRYGYACASFGRPVSLRRWLAERQIDWGALDARQRRAQVQGLGEELMATVLGMIPALPVPIVACVLLGDPERRWPEAELIASGQRLIEKLKAAGAYVYLPGDDPAAAVRAGLRMLLDRRLLERGPGGILIQPHRRRLIAYYGNSIAHLVQQPRSGGETSQTGSTS